MRLACQRVVYPPNNARKFGNGNYPLPSPVTLTKRTEIGADADYKNVSSLKAS